MERKGYGYGQGMGYKNLIPNDTYIHSLNAKGIKSKSKSNMLVDHNLGKDFGVFPTPQKRGLIREIAKKVSDGVGWAIEWEKEHLPEQKQWVKKEFEEAKQEAVKLEKLGQEKLEEWKAQMEEKKNIDKLKSEGFEPYYEDLQNKQDLNDVRNELDVNNDGVQDIPMSELDNANYTIVEGLDTIDQNNNGIPDHREEGFTNISSIEVPVASKPSGEKKLGIPFPMMTGEDLQPAPKQKTFFQKAGEFAQKEIQVGKQYIQQKKQEVKDLHELPDARLKVLAVQDGANMFGGMNKYEKELIRREKERIFLDKKLMDVRQGKETSGGGLGDTFGFLNPIKTLNTPKKNDNTESVLTNSLSFLDPRTAFSPSVKSVPKEDRYYERKLKPKVRKMNEGFNPVGFLNPNETLKTK